MDDATTKQLAKLKKEEAELMSLDGQNTRIAEAGYSAQSDLYQRNLVRVREEIDRLSRTKKEGTLPPPALGNDYVDDPRWGGNEYSGQR